MFGAVVTLFGFFGLAIIPFTYLLSYLFKSASYATNLTLVTNFLLGVTLLMVSFILDRLDDTRDTNTSLKFIWRFSPLFCLGNGLLALSISDIQSNFGRSSGTPSALDLDLIGYDLLYLAIEAVVFFLLTIGTEVVLATPALRSYFKRPSWPFLKPAIKVSAELADTDSDVLAEAKRDASSELIRLESLRKVYPGGKVAVRGLSFGLPQGSCFGFLGINGGGKVRVLFTYSRTFP